MLIFMNQYILIKIKKIKIKKIKINLHTKLKYIFLQKYWNLFVYTNYLKINIFFNFIINLLYLKKRPYFILSNKLEFEQIFINKYLSFNLNKKINLFFYLNNKKNIKTIVFLKKLNIPIFTITNNIINKNVFDYTFDYNKYTIIEEFFFFEFFFFTIIENLKYINYYNKKKYYISKLQNNLKKNV